MSVYNGPAKPSHNRTGHTLLLVYKRAMFPGATRYDVVCYVASVTGLSEDVLRRDGCGQPDRRLCEHASIREPCSYALGKSEFRADFCEVFPLRCQVITVNIDLRLCHILEMKIHHVF